LRHLEQGTHNIVGNRYGQLIVLAFAGGKSASGGRRGSRWLCKCDCGVEKVVFANRLKTGNTKSCGCSRRKTHNGESDECMALKTIEYSYKHSARKRGIHYELTLQDINELVFQPCNYCGAVGVSLLKPGIKPKSNSRKPVPYNGIDRVDNSRGYTLDNVVTCCRVCNVAKRDKTKSEFLSWVEQVYNVSVRRT
jgi:hypothetical protein